MAGRIQEITVEIGGDTTKLYGLIIMHVGIRTKQCIIQRNTLMSVIKIQELHSGTRYSFSIASFRTGMIGLSKAGGLF